MVWKIIELLLKFVVKKRNVDQKYGYALRRYFLYFEAMYF